MINLYKHGWCIYSLALSITVRTTDLLWIVYRLIFSFGFRLPTNPRCQIWQGKNGWRIIMRAVLFFYCHEELISTTIAPSIPNNWRQGGHVGYVTTSDIILELTDILQEEFIYWNAFIGIRTMPFSNSRMICGALPQVLKSLSVAVHRFFLFVLFIIGLSKVFIQFL